MHTAQSAKPTRSDANSFEVGKFNRAIVSDHYVLNVTFTINEHTDLPARFMRKFAELAGKFRSNDLIGRYAPSVQLFDAPQLIWFQPESVA